MRVRNVILFVIILVIAYVYFFTDTSLGGWQGGTYTDPDGLFSFDAPKGWEIDEQKESPHSKVTFDSPKGYMSFTIIVENYNKSTIITDEEYERIRTLPGYYTYLKESIVIDGVDGYLFGYSNFLTAKKGEEMLIHAVVYIKNGYWHTITFAESGSPTGSPVWDQIINSFKSLS
jgi:predicted Zn-dependent protease